MPRTIQSVERAAAVLRLLADGRLGVVELAAALGLAKGTVHGILRTLQNVGFVEQDEATGRYQLGAALLHLGNSYLDVNELRTRALNWSDALATRSRESVRIGTLHDNAVLIVHHVFRPDDSHQVLDVGELLPLHASALGKALLAHNPHVSRELTGCLLKPFTTRTLVDADALTRELEGVRERGWAADVEEMVEGEVSIAAPIRDRRGITVGAIGISGAIERICVVDGHPRMELVSYVRDAARSVARDLGANRR